MGLREIGKAKCTSGDIHELVSAKSTSSLLQDSLGLVSKVREAFGK